MTSVKNVTAHDRWVCFGCRWTAKFPLVDIRANNRPSRLCPKCGVKMRLTGTAFRPPRSDDKEGWQVAEKLMKAGFVFASTRTRRRVPRTLADFDIWLANRDAGEVWLDEQPVKLVTSDGKSVAAVGRRKLLHREPVQIWHQGTWYPLHRPRLFVTGARRRNRGRGRETIGATATAISTAAGR